MTRDDCDRIAREVVEHKWRKFGPAASRPSATEIEIARRAAVEALEWANETRDEYPANGHVMVAEAIAALKETP